eukprot:jgi/Mesvir1/18700/Mv17186-RA.1
MEQAGVAMDELQEPLRVHHYAVNTAPLPHRLLVSLVQCSGTEILAVHLYKCHYPRQCCQRYPNRKQGVSTSDVMTTGELWKTLVISRATKPPELRVPRHGQKLCHTDEYAAISFQTLGALPLAVAHHRWFEPQLSHDPSDGRSSAIYLGILRFLNPARGAGLVARHLAARGQATLSLDLRALATWRVLVGLLLAYECYTWSDGLDLLFHTIGLCAAILLALGLHTRAACVASFLLHWAAIGRAPWVMCGSGRILQMLLLWSVFLPLGKRGSLDALRFPPVERFYSSDQLYGSAAERGGAPSSWSSSLTTGGHSVAKSPQRLGSGTLGLPGTSSDAGAGTGGIGDVCCTSNLDEPSHAVYSNDLDPSSTLDPSNALGSSDQLYGSAATAGITLQVAFVYILVVAHRLHPRRMPEWTFPELSALYYAVNYGHIVRSSPGAFLLSLPHWVLQLLTAGAMLAEMGAPLLLLVTRADCWIRVLPVVLLLLLHAGIMAVMSPGLHPLVGMVGAALLLPSPFWDWVGGSNFENRSAGARRSALEAQTSTSRHRHVGGLGNKGTSTSTLTASGAALGAGGEALTGHAASRKVMSLVPGGSLLQACPGWLHGRLSSCLLSLLDWSSSSTSSSPRAAAGFRRKGKGVDVAGSSNLPGKGSTAVAGQGEDESRRSCRDASGEKASGGLQVLAMHGRRSKITGRLRVVRQQGMACRHGMQRVMMLFTWVWLAYTLLENAGNLGLIEKVDGGVLGRVLNLDQDLKMFSPPSRSVRWLVAWDVDLLKMLKGARKSLLRDAWCSITRSCGHGRHDLDGRALDNAVNRSTSHGDDDGSPGMPHGQGAQPRECDVIMPDAGPLWQPLANKEALFSENVARTREVFRSYWWEIFSFYVWKNKQVAKLPSRMRHLARSFLCNLPGLVQGHVGGPDLGPGEGLVLAQVEIALLISPVLPPESPMTRGPPRIGFREVVECGQAGNQF